MLHITLPFRGVHGHSFSLAPLLGIENISDYVDWLTYMFKPTYIFVRLRFAQHQLVLSFNTFFIKHISHQAILINYATWYALKSTSHYDLQFIRFTLQHQFSYFVLECLFK